MLHRGSNCSLARAMDDRIMRCGIISSCQSAATSEIVKRSWACAHRGAALYQVPDLYLYLFTSGFWLATATVDCTESFPCVVCQKRGRMSHNSQYSCVETSDIKSSRPPRPQGHIFWPRPRSIWPRPRPWSPATLVSFSLRLASWPRGKSSKSDHEWIAAICVRVFVCK